MPGALTSGWGDTGVVATHVLTCDIEMSTMVFGAGVGLPTLDARFDNAGLYFGTAPASGATDLGCTGLTTNGAGASWSTVELYLIHYAGPSPFSGGETYTLLSSRAGSCTPEYFAPIELKKTIGPLRLGATIREGVLVYAWFEDAATTVTYSVDGTLYHTIARGDPPARTAYTFQIADGGASATVLGQGTMVQVARVVRSPGPADDSIADHVRFSNFAGDIGGGAVAITIPETTSYKWQLRPTSEFFLHGGPRFGAPIQWTYDLDCDDTSGAAVAANATLEGARTCPTSFAVTKYLTGITGGLMTGNYDNTAQGFITTAAVLADPWLSAQDVQPYAEDQVARYEGNDPLDPGDATPTDYSTGTITIAASLSILQSANAWSTDLGTVVITGTPTVPIFTVSATPAIVRRELAEHWRAWNDSGDPDYEPTDQYTATRHDIFASGSADDRWGFSLYSYVELDMTVPAGLPTLVAVELTWAVLRGTATIDTFSTTYSPVTFPAGGRSTQRIDLLFPTELLSRPYYGERVDTVRIIGLRSGATTLHAINLVADEDAYVTLSGRRATLRDGTETATGIVVSCDGSAPSLLFGIDRPVSPLPGDLDGDGWADYRGDHQNGAFIVDTVTQEHPGKAPGMLSGTLQATLEELHRIEGITSVYSAAAITAALTDGDGNVVGTDSSGAAAAVTRRADWFVPTLPADRVTPGAGYDVRAQVVVDGVVIPAGVSPADMRIFQRFHLGMILEAVAVDENYERHGAGETVRATAYTGGAPAPGDLVLATETTDASGFVILGVRTGTIGGLQANFILGS